MNNNRGGERTIYDESLFRIFLWSGFPIFMILLFACVAISGIVFIYRHSDPEGVKIIILSISSEDNIFFILFIICLNFCLLKVFFVLRF